MDFYILCIDTQGKGNLYEKIRKEHLGARFQEIKKLKGIPVSLDKSTCKFSYESACTADKAIFGEFRKFQLDRLNKKYEAFLDVTARRGIEPPPYDFHDYIQKRGDEIGLPSAMLEWNSHPWIQAIKENRLGIDGPGSYYRYFCASSLSKEEFITKELAPATHPWAAILIDSHFFDSIWSPYRNILDPKIANPTSVELWESLTNLIDKTTNPRIILQTFLIQVLD